MRFFLLSVIALFLLRENGYCQFRLGNETYQYFSLGGGLGFYQNKDKLLIPTRFNGLGANFFATFTIDQPRTFQKASFRLEAGVEQNRNGYNGGFLFHHLAYSFFYQLLPASRIYAGVKTVGGTDNHFYYGLDDGHLYWLTAYDVEGALMYILDFRKEKQLMIDASLALAGAVSRPPAESFVSNFKNNAIWKDVNSNLQFTAIPQFFKIEGGIQYQLDISLALRYDIEFYTYDEPQPIAFLSHKVTFIKRLGTTKRY